jgi:putative transposase
MPRVARFAPGGIVFHVLNRGVGRMPLFETPGDFDAFERVLEETLAELPMRLLAYIVMANHWHLLLWPELDHHLPRFMQRLTITHVRRWVEFRHDRGNGHVYQGRYKSFAVQGDGHLLTAARYVERNALRAGVVQRAQDWRWCSLWRRERGGDKQQAILCDWPVQRPADWLEWVNLPQTEAEVAAIRQSLRHGRPFGDDSWAAATAQRLGFPVAARPRGRPKAIIGPVPVY